MKLFPGFGKICEESETEISVLNRSTLGDKQEFLLDAPPLASVFFCVSELVQGDNCDSDIGNVTDCTIMKITESSSKKEKPDPE